jgi:predicted RNA-binding protein
VVAERGYWIVVGSPENFAATRAHGFTVQGFKSRHRKKAEQMQPGDKLVYYLTGEKAFAALVTVTSACFEDHTPIWRSKDPKKQGEDYPWRVAIEPEIVLPEGNVLPAEPLASRLRYTRKWPAEHWTLAFQGNLHRIEEDDYEIIRDAMVGALAAV